MEVCCKIKYLIAKDERANQLATEWTREQYELEKEDDLGEESIFDFTKPFSSEDYRDIIREKADEFMRNKNKLPDKATISVSEADTGEMKEKLREKYGIPVEIVDYHKAYPTEIQEQAMRDGMEKLIESEDYKEYIKANANLKYSVNNSSCLYVQLNEREMFSNENMTIASASYWQEHGRIINSGEKALKIFCPSMRVLKTEKDVDDYIDNWHKRDEWYKRNHSLRSKESLMDEIEKEGKAEILVGYRLGNVFSIGQTQSLDPAHDNFEQFTTKKPLDGEYDIKAVNKALNKICGEKYQISGQEVEDVKDLYANIESKARNIFTGDPSRVRGISTREPSEYAGLEIPIATGLVCEHLGIESVDYDGRIIAKMTAIEEGDTAYTEGVLNIFDNAFKRASLFANEVCEEIDKEIGYDRDKRIENQVKNAQKKVTIGDKTLIESRIFEDSTSRYTVGRDGNKYYVQKENKQTGEKDFDGKAHSYGEIKKMMEREDYER